ncbi:MAG: hypothetical protein PHW03_02950 [Eubacteriales bacterium]|nr:hypothetical protein [Eubacteriales bacterium]MDD4389743.1 hypothetical protein [Eubacteriales bacterium]
MYYKSLQTQPPLTYEQAELVIRFRKIMVRLAYLTRFYIIARLTEFGDINVIKDELSRIAVETNELARTVPEFTGNFTQIALNYITGLAGLVDAMIAGDSAQADESIRQLYRLSNENAAYLAEINPNWDKSTWQNIFSEYIQLLVAEVIAIQAGDYNKALDVFNSMIDNSLERGNYYAAGLIPFLPNEGEKISAAYFNMIKDFRKIYTERVYLTRFYIVSKIAGLGDAQYVAQRLNALPGRMKEKFELIFGNKVANKMQDLLLVYVIERERLIDAIISGDEDSIETELARSRELVDEMAAYLSGINPYWSEAEWKDIFYLIIELEMRQTYQARSEEYLDAAQTFKDLMDASLRAADYFAQGFYQYTLMNNGAVAE